MNRKDLMKRALYLEYITVAWNVVESVVAVGAGLVAGSIALTGFGLDSIIGTASVGMLLWKYRSDLKGRQTKEDHATAERRALFVVGIAFFLLALYILNEGGSRFYYKEKPEVSFIGLALSAVSLIITPALAFLKFRTAKLLESKSLRADAVETALCACLAFILFLGMSLYAWRGWWWADPAAALVMLPFIAREGWHAIEESKGTACGAGRAKTES